MMRLIERFFKFKNKDVVPPLYNNFVKPHLGYAVQLWFHHHAKDITELEGVHRT